MTDRNATEILVHLNKKKTSENDNIVFSSSGLIDTFTSELDLAYNCTACTIRGLTSFGSNPQSTEDINSNKDDCLLYKQVNNVAVTTSRLQLA